MTIVSVTLSDGTILESRDFQDLASFPLTSLIFGDGDVLNSDLLDKTTIGLKIYGSLSTAETHRNLAYGLVSLFPDIPSDRAWFEDTSRKPSYGVTGLSVKDLIVIIEAVVSAVFKPATPQAQPSEAEQLKSRIEALQSDLSRLLEVEGSN